MIAPDLLDRVLTSVAPNLDYEELLRHLRAEFPDIHITVCGEDDIPPRLSAAAENEVCLLYYVDAGEHCLKLTNDAEAASGIAVALRGED